MWKSCVGCQLLFCMHKVTVIFYRTSIYFCPSFICNRVNFLPSSWYVVVFWIQYENNVDNTLML